MVTNTQKGLFPKTSSPPESIGVVISTADGNYPNIFTYHFISNESDPINRRFIRQGQYCLSISIEGLVIGVIEQIQVNNQYFQDVQTVKSYNSAKVNLQQFVPSDQWECHIAVVNVLGLIPLIKSFSNDLEPQIFRKIDKVGFPVKPGNQVYNLEGVFLQNFLGFDLEGLNIGILKNYPLDTKLNLHRLFNKHLAILAQSGAGKSYLVSVLLEELLMRSKDTTPALILIDVHGEYRFLVEPIDQMDIKIAPILPLLTELQKRIHHINASFLQIGVPNLSEYDIQHFQPSISLPQMRELRKVLEICRKKYAATGFDLKDIIFTLNDESEGNVKVKEALVAWLVDLDLMGIFGKNDAPTIRELSKLGELSIIDLNTIISMRKKQILLHYFSSRLFQARRNNNIPPYILFLEEAHNWIPESGSHAIAKSIFETLAREGRKFFAQLVLITQRPVHLSTTALSQCNTQIIMRVTNPYDLDHIKATSEALTKDSMRMVNTLPTGSALIMGSAVNYPVFLQVRERKIPNQRGERTLNDICKDFASKNVFTAMEEAREKMIRDEMLDADIISTQD